MRAGPLALLALAGTALAAPEPKPWEGEESNAGLMVHEVVIMGKIENCLALPGRLAADGSPTPLWQNCLPVAVKAWRMPGETERFVLLLPREDEATLARLVSAQRTCLAGSTLDTSYDDQGLLTYDPEIRLMLEWSELDEVECPDARS